ALRPMRVLLVVTYRTADSASADTLGGSLGELQREPGTQRIELHGLTRDEIGEVVRATLGDQVAEALVQQLYDRTEGNPLFVAESLRVLAAERKLPTITSNGAPTLAVPHGVRAVIQRRLAPLSAACRAMLRIASVIGREFAWQLLASVLVLATP